MQITSSERSLCHKIAAAVDSWKNKGSIIQKLQQVDVSV